MHHYSSATVCAALDIKGATLRTWIDRGLFSTPLPMPAIGLTRDFPLLAVYEAACLSWASRRHVLPLMTGAWFWRTQPGPDGPYLVDEARAAFAARFSTGGVHDFDREPAAGDCYWAILLEPDQGGQVGSGPLIGSWSEIQSVFLRDCRFGTLVVNMTGIVRDTHTQLARVTGR